MIATNKSKKCLIISIQSTGGVSGQGFKEQRKRPGKILLFLSLALHLKPLSTFQVYSVCLTDMLLTLWTFCLRLCQLQSIVDFYECGKCQSNHRPLVDLLHKSYIDKINRIQRSSHFLFFIKFTTRRLQKY